MNERDEGFRKELASLINCYSRENGSDTPDFILADYLDGCLRVFDGVLQRREKWYGRKSPFPTNVRTALASPAAAPAAVHCPHGKGNEPCGVCDSEPAPLLPRVLAALEWEATLHAIGRARHVVLTDLAAELRAYIAERAATKVEGT